MTTWRIAGIVAAVMVYCAALFSCHPTIAQGGYTCTQAEGEIASAEAEGETVTVISGTPGLYLSAFMKKAMNATFGSSVVVSMQRPDGFVFLWLQQGEYLCGPIGFEAAEWRKVRRKVWGEEA